MKACFCGTFTEQTMFRQGYLTSKERQAKRLFGKKCMNCAHLQSRCGIKSVRCGKGDFACTINATCKQWEQK